jgi:hypothetical protein
MLSRPQALSQLERLIIFVLYLVLLLVICNIALGSWLPPGDSSGLWFYSGAAALILGSLLLTPFFTSPANAISYLVAVIIAIYSFPLSSNSIEDVIPYNLLLAYCIIILVICLISIVFKDSKATFLHNLSNSTRLIADSFGNPRFVYALTLIYALWEYHKNSPHELFWIGILGLIIVSQQPFETLYIVVKRIISGWRPTYNLNYVGQFVAQQVPGVFLFRQDISIKHDIKYGSCVLVNDLYSTPRIGYVICPHGRDEGLLFRALDLAVPKESKTYYDSIIQNLPDGGVYILSDTDNKDLLRKSKSSELLKYFVGLVAPGSSIHSLFFDVLCETDIEQGRLVEISIGGKSVFYQVLDGLTKEEIILQKNTYGFARGEASQVGVWDNTLRIFKPYNWIPPLNTPVTLKAHETPRPNRNAIGYLPSTNFEVSIKNINELVTHNTAILGILGVGKS